MLARDEVDAADVDEGEEEDFCEFDRDCTVRSEHAELLGVVIRFDDTLDAYVLGEVRAEGGLRVVATIDCCPWCGVHLED